MGWPGALGLVGLLWGLGLGLGWLRVDLWLRHVAPPAADETAAGAARRLWLSGRQAVVLPMWAAVAAWVLVSLLVQAPALLALVVAAVAVLPAVWVPRVFLWFALRKQFSHLAPQWPGWRER